MEWFGTALAILGLGLALMSLIPEDLNASTRHVLFRVRAGMLPLAAVVALVPVIRRLLSRVARRVGPIPSLQRRNGCRTFR